MPRIAALIALTLGLGTPAGAADAFYVLTNNEIPFGPVFLARVDVTNEVLDPIGEVGYFPECLVYSRDGHLYGVDVSADLLVRIDPTSGVGSPVGSMGVFTAWNGSPDLAEDIAGQLWMLAGGTLYQVSRETGAATFVCDSSGDVYGLTSRQGELLTSPGPPDLPPPGCELRLVGIGPQGSAWLTTGSDGWVYGMYWALPHAAGTAIVKADPDTGQEERVAFIWDHDLRGIARAPAGGAATRIPALDWRGVAAMVIATALAGIALLRSGAPRF